EWPDSAFGNARSPFAICIVGDDSFSDTLSRIVEGQKVQGRVIAIHRHRFGDDFHTCQILFISVSERAHVPQILTSVQASNVLTVSDVDRFADDGGVMQFLLDEDRVRFLVNLDAASAAKLHVSAKLLVMARGVISRSEVRKGN